MDYSGFFKLPDGRNSQEYFSRDLKSLRALIKKEATEKMGSCKFVEVFLMNRYGYLHDHYCLKPDGKRFDKLRDCLLI